MLGTRRGAQQQQPQQQGYLAANPHRSAGSLRGKRDEDPVRNARRMSNAYQDVTDARMSTGSTPDARLPSTRSSELYEDHSAEHLLKLQKQQQQQPEEVKVIGGGNGLPRIVANPQGRPVAEVVPLESAQHYQMHSRPGASITGVPSKATWDLQQVQGQRSRLLEALSEVDPRRMAESSSRPPIGRAQPAYQSDSRSRSRPVASGAELGSGLGMSRRPIDERMAQSMPLSSQGEVRLHHSSLSSGATGAGDIRGSPDASMRDMLRGTGRPDIDTMSARDPHRMRGSRYANEAAAARTKGEAYLTMFGGQN